MPTRKKTARSRGRRKPRASDHVIPPKLKTTDIAALIVHDQPATDADDVRQYVELEAPGEKVRHAECLRREYVYGSEYTVWDVTTNKDRYWVVTGYTNLYSHKHFPSADYALSFHIGLTSRIASRDSRIVGGEEPDPSASARRHWKQALAALDAAKEAEDFQAVGMRCRECLLEIIRAYGTTAILRPDTEPPKRGDFVGWSQAIAAYLFPGARGEEARDHLKALAKTTWQYVNWLTHAANAANVHARLANDSTGRLLLTITELMNTDERDSPERCPSCGSYQLELQRTSEGLPDHSGLKACRRCDWRQRP